MTAIAGAILTAFDLLLGVLARQGANLLNTAGKLVAITGDDIDLILIELASPRLHRALELFLIALNEIPVHIRLAFVHDSV